MDTDPASRRVLVEPRAAYEVKGLTEALLARDWRSQRTLHNDPRTAVTIPWVGLARQVGDVEELTRQETEDYARGRPRGSQAISARADLQDELAELTTRFARVGGEHGDATDGRWRVERLSP